jgi:hypothetical protein
VCQSLQNKEHIISMQIFVEEKTVILTEKIHIVHFIIICLLLFVY